jgi:hypothetical protein
MTPTGNGDLAPEIVAELRRLARSRPTSGRARVAKLGAIRTLERLDRDRGSPDLPVVPILGMMMGPTPRESVEELECAWAVHGERLMSSYAQPARAGCRPWAWWRLEAREEPPDGMDAQAVRLAELGLLRRDELAVLRERATEARLRVDTDDERSGPDYFPDRDAVAAWGAVERAIGQAPNGGN